MKFALLNGVRVEAQPHMRAVCPVCEGAVFSKCGHFKEWHWAHEADECDHWTEPESEWHRNWKNRFPKEYQEKVIKPHRADVCYEYEVVEFQHSHLAVDKILERESFYGSMFWVIDVNAQADNFKVDFNKDPAVPSYKSHTLVWSRPKKEWFCAHKPLFLDFGKGWLFGVNEKIITDDGRYILVGGYLSYDVFVNFVAETANQYFEQYPFSKLLGVRHPYDDD